MSGVAVEGNHAPVRMPNLIIWFKRMVSADHSDAWLLDRITISMPSLFQDTKINDNCPASQRFTDDAWTFLSKYLPTNAGELVLSSQRACLEAPSYLLYGVAAVGKEAMEGTQEAFITIKNFLGSPKDLFRNNSFPDLLSELACHLSARTLSDVVIPALNLVESRPSIGGTEAKVTAFIERLEAKKHDIQFYAALISRFVASKNMQSDKHPISPATDIHRKLVDAGSIP